MSSHHIVREKQEPALLVLGLDNFPDELLGQLLEWSPTVITTVETAEKLVSYGIKIDWIIADSKYEVLQSDVKLLPCRDGNLLNTAFYRLLNDDYSAVNIITDELNLNYYEPFTDKINLVIFHRNKKIYPVNPGFSKWKPAGETIELLGKASALDATGLDSIGYQQYKTTHNGFFHLKFDAPFLFIAEDLS